MSLHNVLQNITQALHFPGGNQFRFCHIRCQTCGCQRNELRCPLGEDQRVQQWTVDQLQTLDKSPMDWAHTTMMFWPCTTANLLLFGACYGLSLEQPGEYWAYWRGRFEEVLKHWGHGKTLAAFIERYRDSQDPEIIEAVEECQAIIALTDTVGHKERQHND